MMQDVRRVTLGSNSSRYFLAAGFICGSVVKYMKFEKQMLIIALPKCIHSGIFILARGKKKEQQDDFK